MPDIERQAVVDIVVNKDKAEQQYSDFIKKIEEPVKLEIDADVRDAVAAIKELQNMFKALTNQAKDGEKLRINVQGMAKLQQQLAQVDDTLSTLSNHFTGLRRSVDIQAELNDNQRALQSYQNSFKGVVDQINKLKSKRTTDNFFNMHTTKTNITDILSGASFKQVYEDSQGNVSRLLVEIAKAAQETDGLAKTIQLSETESVSLADIFKAITTSIEASGKSLSDLKIEGLSADIIDVLKNIQKLESEIPTLQAKFEDAVNREKAGSINVQIDAKSIESLSEAISELKGVFKVEDGSTIGFKEEDIDRITSSFSELQTVLENIHNLLSSFDLPKIKAPEVETGEEKPRRESRSTTTVSTTMPTINGGTRTVTNTSDSSTSTGGVSGVEAAVDGQNRLQQELRETRQEAESTQDALQEVRKGVDNPKFDFSNKSFDELVNISNIKKGSDELNAALRESMEHLVEMYSAGNTESEEYYGTLYRIINLQKQMWKFNEGNGSGYDALAQSTKDAFSEQTKEKMRLQDSILGDLKKYSGIDLDVIDSATQIITDLKNDVGKPLFQPFKGGKPMSVDNFKKYYLDMLRETSKESPISSGVATLPEQEREAGQAGQQMGESIADGANAANTSLQVTEESLNRIISLAKEFQTGLKTKDAFNFATGDLATDVFDPKKFLQPLVKDETWMRNYIERTLKKGGYSQLTQMLTAQQMWGGESDPESAVFADVKTKVGKQKAALFGSIINEYTTQWEQVSDRLQTIRTDIVGIIQGIADSMNIKIDSEKLFDGLFSGLKDVTKDKENTLQWISDTIDKVKISNETPVLELETHPEEFEREASAAAEDREEIEKLNNEKRESPELQSDSAEIEKQGEAYREATADAEKFAEAKRETSGETPSSTAVSESFQRETEAVREAMTAEGQALDELKQKLIGEIPNAVDTKTQAFRSEQVEVSDLIDLEIGKVEELAKVLQSLFKGDSDSGVMSGLKDLFDSINKVKINKDTVQNLTDASWAIDTIGESFKKLSNEGLNSSAFDSLNDLLKKGEELKSLAKILDASEKKIATAGKAAGAGTTGKTTANPTKDATAEYKELLETIQAATKAKTELNKIETKQVNGKTVDAQLADATSKSTAASKAAADAMARIDEMYKAGVISVEQYTAAQKALQDSLKGTAESVDALATARKNAQRKQLTNDIKNQVDAQKRDLKEYETLYKNSTIGKGLNPADATRMESLVDNIANRQAKWNEEIARGNDLYAKMTSEIESAADVRARVNKDSTTKMTADLNKELEKMNKQSSWRPKSWKENIQDFEGVIAQFNQKIKDGVDFQSLQEDFNKAMTKVKADMKDTDFLPIRETWKSSFTAKIETWANQNKIAAKEFGEQLETLKGQIAAVDNEAEASRLENIFSRIQSDAASKNLLGKSLGDRFKDQFKNTMTSLATYYLSFQDFIRYGREAISVVTELDTQLTEMRKVSNESLQTLQNYQLETFDIADRVGTTASQIQSSTADWLRLGKNLPEAANMAEISTKLLNVSEFTDIKDATDALVSATQAYTDVTASDIVDKLNLIGNNFAVSTDELAQGLQNAGAVLKTQGNDLDQTLALLTAGNLIGQDMSKASAGIRTIALRISGTEEAKNEIADMGEDVDDFVVRTRSKTDQIIRDYTAVASNMYKGVSVLDPNGNLRDTYDILLDISKIYSEIQAEDKQRGTNRAQALVEQLAGIILPDKYRNIFLRTHLNALIT